MSLIFYLLKAWLIGIAVAAPVGPIGALCIRKTLEMGFVGAIAVGLGAALADSAYGLVAALGLSAISHFLLQNTIVIRVFGGLFLLYLAYKEIKSTSGDATSSLSGNLYKLIAGVFLLTLTNPMTILSFIGIFASIGSGAPTSLESLTMVIGIFLGSMTWWLILGSIIVKIKHKLSEVWVQRIRYLSALLLAGFGVFAIVGSI
jgi:putative LysE/RhtB family amino acid efflux pump